MKNIGLLILGYNITSLCILFCDFIQREVVFFGHKTELYQVIDLMDIPFYVILGIVTLSGVWRRFKGFKSYQIYCIISNWLFLIVKIIPLSFQNHYFWGWIFCILPIALIIDEKYNVK